MPLEHITFAPEGEKSPYSDLVILDNRELHLSGLIAMDLDTEELRYGTVTEETRLILNNLSTLLERHGSDMDHVVRATVLLSDFSERDEMNAEYVRHFHPRRLPARLCFGNVGLHGKCKVEIAVPAVKR